MVTDHEILHEVLEDCFWAGVFAGKAYYNHSTAAAQAATTVHARITELLDCLGLVMEDNMLVEDECIHCGGFGP